MKNKFNLPLINAHCHAAMVGLRGRGEGLALHEWLHDCIFPAEKQLINPEFVYQQTLNAIDEMKSNGIYSFMDMYFYQEEVAKAAEEKNMHVLIGEGLIDIRGQEAFDNDLKKTEKLLKDFKDSKYVSVSVAPHSPYTVGQDNLIKAKDLARKYNVKYQIHVAETKNEFDNSLKERGVTPIEYLDSIGVLDKDTTLIHCVWLNDKDIEIVASRKCKIVHCPLSNLKLGSGVAPVSNYLEAGIVVAIGTDGAASSNRLDVWEAGKFASLIQKGINHNPELLTSREVIKMMTINGIIALGLENNSDFNIKAIQEEIDKNDYDYIFHLNSNDLFN